MDGLKPKPIIPAEHAIYWYVGNYLTSPNNALREDEALFNQALAEMEKFRVETKGKRMTHKQFLDLMKERGVHDKYYRYQKHEQAYCLACNQLGVPSRRL